MTECVEAIRRQAEDIINEWLDVDYAVATRPVPTKRERERLADRIVAALAQAERERAALVIERDKIEDRLSVAIDNLRAEVERLPLLVDGQNIRAKLVRRGVPALKADCRRLSAEVERLTKQTTYPDDPARSVAAMLERMSAEDKQAFNFCVKAAVRDSEAALARVRAAN